MRIACAVLADNAGAAYRLAVRQCGSSGHRPEDLEARGGKGFTALGCEAGSRCRDWRLSADLQRFCMVAQRRKIFLSPR